MELKEKVAYIKGMLDGMELDSSKKETKVINALVDIIDELAVSVTELQDANDEICDLLDVLDEDLGDVEEVLFGDDEDGCNCDDCDDDCDCDGDGDLYEVTCPSCGEVVYVDEEMLDEGEIACPGCGTELEFDLELDGCEGECGCGCEHDHEHK